MCNNLHKFILNSLSIDEVTAKFDSTISNQNYMSCSVFENMTDIFILLLEVILNNRHNNGRKKLTIGAV